MPFNGNTAFFTAGTQMGLTGAQRTALAAQGLTVVDDFADFGKDELKEALKNMRTSIPGIPAIAAVNDAQGNEITAAVDAVPPVLPVILPARCTQRLTVAAVAWHYYTDTAREVTAVNMHYNNILKDFQLEWKAITAMAELPSPLVPCITKNNPPLRWTDTFRDYCMNTFGVRTVPLAYIIRTNVDVLPELLPLNNPIGSFDPLAPGKPYGNGGSVLNDMIARLSHDHPLYTTDNAKVYSALEEASRGTAYSSTVKAFSRRRDGRSAWLALVSSHAGNDKWESLQKENTRWLMNTKWNGMTYSLEKFCNQHRSRFVNLEEAKNHVDFQLPTSHTRVGYLLDNITNDDADLRAAIANIRQNVNNTRSDFENAVAVLLPVDPFLKKKIARDTAKSNTGTVAATTATATTTNKSGTHIGTTGVKLQFHTDEMYRKLTKEQKKELHDWRTTADGAHYSANEKKKLKNKTSHTDKTLRSAIKAALAQERKKQKESDDDIESLAQVIATAAAKSTTATSSDDKKPNVSAAISIAHRTAASELLKKRAANKALKNCDTVLN